MTLLKLTQMTTALTMISVMMACGNAQDDKTIDCESGKTIEANSQTYCVFKSAITEEGFNCPADASIGRRYGELVICAENNGDIPQEMIDKLPTEYPNETLPTGDCKNVLCDLDKTCSGGTCSKPQTEEQCLASCGDGCPAPEFQTCASDGQRYCNECVIGCKGLTKADESKCGNPQSIDACIMSCGAPGGNDWVCGDDNKEYASECILNCKGINKASDPASCTSKETSSCSLACGVGCPAPEFQICGEDGNKYCNECEMGCQSIKTASDASICNQ